MKTIRIKLFFLFSLFMIVLVISGIFLNSLFLKDYYIIKNRNIMLEKSREISFAYIHEPANITEFIRKIDRTEAIKCIIADKNLIPLYNSFPLNQSNKLPLEIEQLILNNKSILSKTYLYATVNKPREQEILSSRETLPRPPPPPPPSKDGDLAFIVELDNGEMIVLTKSINGITESASIANQFYLFAGLLIILLGGLFLYYFSKKLVSPIIEMSQVADSIASLDFTKRVSYHAQDEIGSLGNSMNHIAQKLNTSIEGLKQDVERRKQLVRNISHELKTPIGVIKGYAEGLKFGVADNPEKIQKYYQVITDECDRMDNLVQELLNLSMLESGMFQLKMTRFSLTKLIKQIANRFSPVIQEKEIGLILDVPEDLEITADCNLIERLINNYLTNAISHVEGKKQIRVSVQQKDGFITMSVFNTGRPILKEDQTKIWDVFYKVDQARTRQNTGHGLGLFIVGLITELHHGAKGVENKEDGVLFFAKIPDNL